MIWNSSASWAIMASPNPRPLCGPRGRNPEPSSETRSQSSAPTQEALTRIVPGVPS